MRHWLSILSAVLLLSLLSIHEAAAAGPTDDDKRASCSNREAPDKTYKGEAWLDYHDNGKGGWVVTSINARIRSLGLPMGPDNQINVQVHDFTRSQVAYAEFKRLVNANLTLQRNLDPWVTVPKGKLGVRLLMVTSMDSWPKSCSAAGIVF